MKFTDVAPALHEEVSGGETGDSHGDCLDLVDGAWESMETTCVICCMNKGYHARSLYNRVYHA